MSAPTALAGEWAIMPLPDGLGPGFALIRDGFRFESVEPIHVEFSPGGTMLLIDTDSQFPIDLPRTVAVADLCRLAGILARVQKERRGRAT